MESKQKIAQRILSQGNRLKALKTTLLYTPSLQKDTVNIVVSVAKKNVKLATNRTVVKRKLRGVLRNKLPKEILFHHDWMWIYKDNETQIDKTINEFIDLLNEHFHKEANN